MRINWEIFFGSSSIEEAICLFASKQSTFKQFSKEAYPRDCRKAIKHLKHRGYEKAIRAARKALKVRGFKDYKEDMINLRHQGHCCLCSRISKKKIMRSQYE